MAKKQKQHGLLKLRDLLEKYEISYTTALLLISPDSYALGEGSREMTRLSLQDQALLTEDGDLTERSQLFLKEVDGLFKTTTSRAEPPTVDTDKVVRYREIFPNITLGTGKRARSSEKDLVGYFLRFFKHYPEYRDQWDLIFKAAELYVEEFSKKNYEFMRTASYFIIKQANDRSHSSDLADYCERVLSGDDESKPQFKIKVV